MRAARSVALLAAIAAAWLVRSHAASAAWPPAPGADLRSPANWPDDPAYGAAWPYFSRLPTQQPGTAPYLDADVRLGASGMSVDRAWAYTIGRPDVIIAVADSGIHWDDPDLVNKAHLNRRELLSHKPRRRDGGDCGGTGELLGFDCDGDGVLTVADYRDDPRIHPPLPGEPCFVDVARRIPGPDRIQGDVNRNCVLDAGDLIELFSDGIDDDANGYTDDIAGWDFSKNDNNPYDDTRLGHGTRLASYAAQEGNNGIGGIGACPLCRFLPLRVGDGPWADANDFAKALVYAADNGASVAQAALRTVDMTTFARAAMDYAYAKGVVIVSAMGDDNARHHAFPGAYQHSLPVNSVRYQGPSFDRASTFLAFNTCGSFGGQLALSVSGAECSGEAVGHASGIAGLLVSYARAQPAAIALTAEEVFQLLKSTADDVDVPESRSPENDGLFYASKPGFDQRFGYGRANAFRALDAIRTGLIPPEVDILSPGFFDIVHASRAPGAVPILGRVAATRAQSYDVRVEYAPGVEPDESAFLPLAGDLRNVPSSAVTGGPDAPLATFDPREIDTFHAPDPDSRAGENERTLTLRVRATAHYAGGDVTGEARRTIAVSNTKNGADPDLLPGFPIKLGGSLEASSKLADLDGDGIREIVQPSSDGQLHVFTLKSGLPAPMLGFPYRANPMEGFEPALPTPSSTSYRNVPAYLRGRNGGVDPDVREPFLSAPAVADLDGDGALEIVATTLHGTIHVIDAQGRARPGWPVKLPAVPSCPLDPQKPRPEPCMDLRHAVSRGALAAPVLADLDGDGRLDVVQAGFDGLVHVLRADGSAVEGWPVAVHDARASRVEPLTATPAVADFNGDGIPDLAVASNEEIAEGVGLAFLVDGRGNRAPGGPFLPNWPVTVASTRIVPAARSSVVASPVVADVDRDGVPDVLFQGNGGPPLVLRADPGAQDAAGSPPPNRLPVTRGGDARGLGFVDGAVFGALSQASAPDGVLPLLSAPAMGDLDLDGVPDAIVSGGSSSFAANRASGAFARPFQHLLGMWSGRTGLMMPASPIALEDAAFFVNAAVADLSGDDYPEVILGSAGYFLHAVDACGREASGFPKFTNGWHVGAAAVGDVDGDRALEIVAGTREGYLFAWHTRGRDDGVVQWDSFHHDARNTGDLRVPLDQGRSFRPARPLACLTPPAPEAEAFDASGGCACTETPGHVRFDAAALTATAGALALGLARRRRPRIHGERRYAIVRSAAL